MPELIWVMGKEAWEVQAQGEEIWSEAWPWGSRGGGVQWWSKGLCMAAWLRGGCVLTLGVAATQGKDKRL